jgi:hypothetical protein
MTIKCLLLLIYMTWGFSKIGLHFPIVISVISIRTSSLMFLAKGTNSFNSAHSHSTFSDDPSANNLGYSGNVSESYPQVIEGHPHPVHDNQSESHASGYLCEWNDGQGPCHMTIRNEKEVAVHMASFHLPRPGRDVKVKCRWKGCTAQKSFCRDTIHRHVRQIHLKIRPRRQS